MPENFQTQEDLDAYIARMETAMREAAQRFEFEKAAKLRDTIRDLRSKDFLFDAPKDLLNHRPPPRHKSAPAFATARDSRRASCMVSEANGIHFVGRTRLEPRHR